MKRSFTQRSTALMLATSLNAAAAGLLVQQPAAGRGSSELDTAGVTRAEALAASAQPPSGDWSPGGVVPAKAGTQCLSRPKSLDSRLRGNDGYAVPTGLPRRS